MDTRSNGTSDEPAVSQPRRRTSKPENDQLNTIGETLLQLIDKAAGLAEENSRQALEIAQKYSHQLQSAEARVAELEAEVDSYREKADRAEQWLHRLYTEIEDRFSSAERHPSGHTTAAAERKASLRLELVQGLEVSDVLVARHTPSSRVINPVNDIAAKSTNRGPSCIP